MLSTVSFASYNLVRGDPDGAFAAADIVVEGEYRTGRQEHAYLEPQVMLAEPGASGSFAVTGSLQNPWFVHAAIARALGMARSDVRVIAAPTGGGFGGKEDVPSQVAIHAALLARAAGRPVLLAYGRQEDMVATSKRHPSIVRHRTGVTREGDLVAQDIEVVFDGGAYATVSPAVLSRGAIHASGPYRCPNVRVRARAMMTNTAPNGAFRGFGNPQTAFAAELQLDRVAEAVGIPALEMRRRHAYREGDVTVTGQVLRNSVAAGAVLERAVAEAGFDEERRRTAALRAEREARWAADPDGKPPRLDGPHDRVATGVGLALGWHGTGYSGAGEGALGSRAAMELTAGGRIRALSAQTEMGQGAETALAQIVADVLDVPADAVQTAPADTSVVPDSGPTVASRSTMIPGWLLAEAARQLRSEVECRTGGSFAATYRADAATHGPSRIEVAFPGFPGTPWDEEHQRGDAFAAYSWAAAVVWVDIELDTGLVAVRRVVAADDAGRIINPLLASGQVEGGTLQGVGFATSEDMRLAGGRLLHDRLATYLIPTAADAPRIETHFVEAPFPDVPHGAKGLGELPMDVPAPAIVDAIHDAIAVWITSLPASPDRVLAAIEARRLELRLWPQMAPE